VVGCFGVGGKTGGKRGVVFVVGVTWCGISLVVHLLGSRNHTDTPPLLLKGLKYQEIWEIL